MEGRAEDVGHWVDRNRRAKSCFGSVSFATAHRLIREEGLLVGGSAGTAVAAALRVAASGRARDRVVALLPDSWDRYFTTAWLRGARA